MADNIDNLNLDQEHQCSILLHQNICHGDIKLENILVSSWLWLTLTDFASFKPTYLPADNPADYSYFFDTRRRRACYIAPERFVQKASNLQADEGGDVSSSGQLQKSMDVFSVGCCIGEIFTDGDPVFDFSNLLSYREANDNSYDPSQALMKIDDEDIRYLVRKLSKKTKKRRNIYNHSQNELEIIFRQKKSQKNFPYVSSLFFLKASLTKYRKSSSSIFINA